MVWKIVFGVMCLKDNDDMKVLRWFEKQSIDKMWLTSDKMFVENIDQKIVKLTNNKRQESINHWI